MKLEGLPARIDGLPAVVVSFSPEKLVLREGTSERVVLAESFGETDARVAYRGHALSPSQLVTLLEHPTSAVSLLDLHAVLHEAKVHYPFKRKAKLGPAIRGGTNKKAKKWDCNCTKKGDTSVCKCDDLTGDTSGKVVNVDLAYKRAYMKEYRPWLAKQAKAKLKKKKKAA